MSQKRLVPLEALPAILASERLLSGVNAHVPDDHRRMGGVKAAKVAEVREVI
jgi:hypothetical protein